MGLSVDKTETPGKASSVSAYSKHFESAICSNLREIQQEEEIIFFEPIRRFDAHRPADVTFNGAGSKQVHSSGTVSDRPSVSADESSVRESIASHMHFEEKDLQLPIMQVDTEE